MLSQSKLNTSKKYINSKVMAFMRSLPAETSHNLGLWLLKNDLHRYIPKPQTKMSELTNIGLKMHLPGVGSLPHPIGLAAGFDKNCIAPYGFKDLDFSFIEIGTVTPRPQNGNPKPRLFRYPEQHAIINRMGFNNHGALAVARRLRQYNWDYSATPIGINLGKNKKTPEDQAINDYIDAYKAFLGQGSYYVINVSSPNTPGLRNLASPEFIRELTAEFKNNNQAVWIKLDPDMDKEHFQKVVEQAIDSEVSGLILTNTHSITYPEKGGQSGHPLAIPSTKRLEWAWEVHRGVLPMIGCGGIMSGLDIYEKVIRGANAIQIYSALVYRGPWVVQELLLELALELKQRNIECLEDAIGIFYNS